jgi:chromosome segregation ATPase
MMEQLRTDLATLSVETEKLRSDLLSAHQASEQIRQELYTAKETLSNTEVTLGDVQARLEHCQRSYDEFKSTVARREEENSASITKLTERIDFSRSHPFKALFMSIIDRIKVWAKTTFRGVGNFGFGNRLLSTNNGDCPA